jgi:hypothetical protein
MAEITTGPNPDKLVPKDRDGYPEAAGTVGFSQSLTATGNWQAVILESECKRLSINCDDGSAAYDHLANVQEFHFSFDNTGAGRKATNNVELSISARQGDTVCYVRATAGLVFSIAGIK